MAEKLRKADLLRRVDDRIHADSLGEDFTLTFRVRGGMPSERRDDEVTIAPGSRLQARVSDRILNLDFHLDETTDAARAHRVAAGIRGIMALAVSREQIEFLPDELIGSVEIRVGNESSNLYFHVEEKRLPRPERLTAETVEGLAGRLTEIHKKQEAPNGER